MVEIKNLSKSFNHNRNRVLDQLNLSIFDGEILSIIGESGVGKSVFVKCLIGLIKPDSGQIFIDGEEITDLSEEELNKRIRIKMGMVYQYGALWDSLTVGENIKLGLKFKRHLPESEMDKITDEILELVGLPEVKNKYPDELSGGMNKRISIARAIVMKPKYLIYDEPTTGLDPVLINIIDDLIVKLNKEHKITSLVISHNIHSAETISDRVCMLYQGKIIHLCDADKIWKQDNKIFNQFIHGDVKFQ
ncbi:MAG TPA: ATP-binding cassette domain-containing protein [Ignavibacteria bacterium]|mgnify:CR=1 FL=1|nr:ATP-binding cassette domain-containing protein [Ignavibacteria bacterium]